MDIKIDFLKNHVDDIPDLVRIWYESLSKIWVPHISLSEIQSWYDEEIYGDDDLPITFIAMVDGKCVGACSIRHEDDIRPDLKPWLASLVVDQKYCNLGIGKTLVRTVIDKAIEMNFFNLYLYVFDSGLVSYYEKYGFRKFAVDDFAGNSVIVMKMEL